jgi:hypothetical protein
MDGRQLSFAQVLASLPIPEFVLTKVALLIMTQQPT